MIRDQTVQPRIKTHAHGLYYRERLVGWTGDIWRYTVDLVSFEIRPIRLTLHRQVFVL